MAGRNVELRSVDSYTRDIRSLLRLRTAILIDTSLDVADRAKAVEHIDALVKMVQQFSNDIIQAEMDKDKTG